jgi:hypothetical protein
LIHLKELYIHSVKAENLVFLSNLNCLEALRIINGNITTIEGLEKCKNLNKLRIVRCKNLNNIMPTLILMQNIERVDIEACKNITIKEKYFFAFDGKIYIQ